MDLLKKASPDDDDIIDLTDIIEQGPTAMSAQASAEQEMETQMDTLFTKGNKEAQQLLPNDMEADIDALLADMESGDTSGMAAGADTPPKQAAAPSPDDGKTSPAVLNPDETLDMPNMTEVDALLEGLDIPPQPREHTATPPPEDLGDDLDNLLGDLLDGSSTPAAKAAPAPKSPVDDIPDDLDALLAGAAAELDAPGAAAQPKAAESDAELDIDALLAGAAAELDAPTAHDERSFDDELQSLLDEAASPSPTRKAGARAATAPPSLEDDIDALFAAVGPKDDSQNATANTKTTSAAQGAPAESQANEPHQPHQPNEEDDDFPVDLSDMDVADTSTLLEAEELADIVLPTKGPKKTKAPHPVDDLLEGLDLDTAPEPAPAASAPAPAIPAADTDMDTDMDTGAGVSMPLATNAEDIASQPAKPSDDISALMAEPQNEQDPLNTVPQLDIALVSPTDMADMPDMPGSSPRDEEDLPELAALDALLQAASSPLSDSPEDSLAPVADDALTDMELATDHSTLDALSDTEFTDEEIAQAAQTLYDEKIMAEATTGEVDTNAWLNSLDEVLEEDATTDTAMLETIVADSVSQGHTSADPSPLEDLETTESIDQLLANLPKDVENTHYVYRPNAGDAALGTTPLEAPGLNQQNAANKNFENAYEQELARLQHITDRFAQSLAAADMHIAALTNTTSNAVPSMRGLDDMFRQDSPFSTALHSLVRSAVASELKSPTPMTEQHDAAPAEAKGTKAPTPEAIHTLEQRLDGLATQMLDLQERISALEEGNKEARLQTVETRVDGQVKTMIHLEEQYKIFEAHLEAQAKSQSNLENRFQHEVEKAAAAAAAKIIREEIAGILAGN